MAGARVPLPAAALGVAGLLPFAAGALAAWGLMPGISNPFTGLLVLQTYGAAAGSGTRAPAIRRGPPRGLRAARGAP